VTHWNHWEITFIHMAPPKTSKNSPVSSTDSKDLFSDVPPDVYAKVEAAAKTEERSIAAQVRVIVKAWAEGQPEPKGARA
jgi:hypothetical protein